MSIDVKRFFKSILVKNVADSTKQIELTIDNAATTATTTTITAKQTANRTITLPDTDGTLIASAGPLGTNSVVTTSGTGQLTTGSGISTSELQSLEGITGVVETRLDNLEAADIAIDTRLDNLEAADIALDLRLDVLETDPTTKTYVDGHLGGNVLDQTGPTINDVVTWDGTKYVLAPQTGGTPGANTSLSNLTPTAINQDMMPDTDSTRNVGSAVNRFLEGNFDTIRAATVTIDNDPSNPTDGVRKSYADGKLGGATFDQTGAAANDVVTWDGTKYVLATPVITDVPLVVKKKRSTDVTISSQQSINFDVNSINTTTNPQTSGGVVITKDGTYEIIADLWFTHPTTTFKFLVELYLNTTSIPHLMHSETLNAVNTVGTNYEAVFSFSHVNEFVNTDNLFIRVTPYSGSADLVSLTSFMASTEVVSGSGVGAGVTDLNGLTGSVTLAAGSNISLTPVGNTITIASTGGGSGANQTLSNLTSPTAINQNLLADTPATRDIGSPSYLWANVYTSASNVNVLRDNGGSLEIQNITGGQPINVSTYTNTGISGEITIETGPSAITTSGGVNIKTGTGAVGSGAMLLTTGNSTSNATGNNEIKTGNSSASYSGDINLLTGTSSTINTGSINLTTGDGVTDTGSLNFKTGQSQAGSGDIILETGNLSTDGLNGTGDIIVKTGETFNTLNYSGALQLQTGDSYGNSGLIDIRSGASTGSGSANTGGISIRTGDSSSAAAGDIQLIGGQSLSSGGNIIVTSGNTSSPTFDGGDISIITGSGPNRSGDITIRTSDSVGQVGDINIYTNDPFNLAGNVNISAQSTGSNNVGTVNLWVGGTNLGSSSSSVKVNQGQIILSSAQISNTSLTLDSIGVASQIIAVAGAFRMPLGTTDPAPLAIAGNMYYNTSTNKLRLYDGTSWVDLN